MKWGNNTGWATQPTITIPWYMYIKSTVWCSQKKRNTYKNSNVDKKTDTENDNLVTAHIIVFDLMNRYKQVVAIMDDGHGYTEDKGNNNNSGSDLSVEYDVVC